MGKTITLNLRPGDDERLKGMIQALQVSDHPENPYIRRSESEIGKLVLAKALNEEYRKFCTGKAEG